VPPKPQEIPEKEESKPETPVREWLETKLSLTDKLKIMVQQIILSFIIFSDSAWLQREQ
jgi:hypothetical protein